jgi:hypothetical protein
MRNPKLVEWEEKLKKVFDDIDDYLEDTYGKKYTLHPSRPGRGETANKEHDGLFNIGASFSAGYGSEYGRGYVVDIDMVTLQHVPDAVEEQIEEDVMKKLKKELPKYFPNTTIHIHKDGRIIKIHGDLRLY